MLSRAPGKGAQELLLHFSAVSLICQPTHLCFGFTACFRSALSFHSTVRRNLLLRVLCLVILLEGKQGETKHCVDFQFGDALISQGSYMGPSDC